MKQPLNPIELTKLFHSVLGLGKGLDVLNEMERLFGTLIYVLINLVKETLS